MIRCAEQEQLEEVHIEGAGKCSACREVLISFIPQRSVIFLERASDHVRKPVLTASRMVEDVDLYFI